MCSLIEQRSGCTKFCLPRSWNSRRWQILRYPWLVCHDIKSAMHCSLRLAPTMINHLTSYGHVRYSAGAYEPPLRGAHKRFGIYTKTSCWAGGSLSGVIYGNTFPSLVLRPHPRGESGDIWPIPWALLTLITFWEEFSICRSHCRKRHLWLQHWKLLATSAQWPQFEKMS